MKNYISAKISSKYTTLSFVGMVLMWIILIPLIFVVFSDFEFKVNQIIAALLFLAVIAAMVYATMNLAYARIENNKFYLKKFLRPEKVYDVRDLCDLKTYDVGRDHYIIFTMKNGAEKEQFLVYTSRHIFYRHEKLNSQTILREILEDNRRSGQN